MFQNFANRMFGKDLALRQM